MRKMHVVQMIKHCHVWYDDDDDNGNGTTPEVSTPTVFFFDRRYLHLKRVFLGDMTYKLLRSSPVPTIVLPRHQETA